MNELYLVSLEFKMSFRWISKIAQYLRFSQGTLMMGYQDEKIVMGYQDKSSNSDH